MTKRNYTFKRLDAESFKDVIAIYEDSFGQLPDINELRKKYLTGSVLEDYMGIIAYSTEQEPAAFMGMFPVFVNLNNKKIIAAQIGDLMTHSKHRRQGLFKKVAQASYLLAKEKGISHFFALGPNKYSYPAFVDALKWDHISDFHCFLFITNNRYLHRFKKYNYIEKNALNYIKKIPSSFKSYISLIDPDNSMSTRRDLAFLEYKNYFNKKQIEINNKQVIFKVSKKYMYIGDIEDCSFQEFTVIIKLLKSIAKKCNIPYLRFNLSTNTKLYEYVSKLGKKMESEFAIVSYSFNNETDFSNYKMTLLDHDNF